MYKVFDNDRLIILSEKPIKKELNVSYKRVKQYNLLEYWKESDQKTINIYHNNIKKLWSDFKKCFTIVKAAGGLVSYKKKFLVIHRKGKWDLPKGKIEKGESKKDGALREVEEECGVKNILLGKKKMITYHIYELKGKQILKPTFWYEMSVNEKQKLKPQTEEGISIVKWHSKKKTNEIKLNTYPNIILAIKNLV